MTVRRTLRLRALGARVALALLLVLFFSACGEEEKAPELTPTSVSLAAVRAVDLTDRIEAAGELVPKESAEIAAEVAGRITEIHMEEGSSVVAGQPVLSIDPERRELEVGAATAELEEARAALTEAERELARVARLRERTVASQTKLEQAQTALQRARSQVAGATSRVGVATRALRDATVTAPFAGLIGRRNVSRGEFVNTGTPLFDLVALDPVEVEFHVAERDSSRVRLGQTVGVRVAPFPEEHFAAVVSMIAPTIDTGTRTLRVKALMANPNDRLRPGLFAHVDLGISERTGVAVIPEDAVLRRADGAVVFRFTSDHRVERVVIETGVMRDGVVEVISGVAPGEIVVARGHNRLVDGDLVVPRDNDGNLLTSLPNLPAEPGS